MHYLDVSFNQIEDRGLFYIAEALMTNVGLQVIKILGNKFTNRSMFNLSKSLVSNKRSMLYMLLLGEVTFNDSEVQQIMRSIA